MLLHSLPFETAAHSLTLLDDPAKSSQLLTHLPYPAAALVLASMPAQHIRAIAACLPLETMAGMVTAVAGHKAAPLLAGMDASSAGSVLLGGQVEGQMRTERAREALAVMSTREVAVCLRNVTPQRAGKGC
jgi:hypothetical protein